MNNMSSIPLDDLIDEPLDSHNSNLLFYNKIPYGQWIDQYNIIKEELEKNVDVYSMYKYQFWIQVNKNTTDSRKIELLKLLPNFSFDFDPNEYWNMQFEYLEKYIQKYKKLPTYSFIQWFINDSIIRKKKHNLPLYRLDKFDNLPISIFANIDPSWISNFHQLRIDMKTKVNYDCDFTWVYQQLMDYKHKRLHSEKIRLLSTIPTWKWDNPWMLKYDRLKNYLTNNKMPTRLHPVYGNFTHAIKMNYENLDKWQKDLINELPNWSWGIREDRWKETYDKVNALFKSNSTIRPYTWWISAQKQLYKMNKLSKDRMQLLNLIPNWSWDTMIRKKALSKNEKWKIKCQKIINLINDTPYLYDIDKNDIRWIRMQIRAHIKGNLNYEQESLMRQISVQRWVCLKNKKCTK